MNGSLTASARTDDRGRPAADAGAAILLVPAVAAILLALRPLQLSDNSIHYLRAVRDSSLADPPFYPPHLLHMPAIAVLHRLTEALGCDVACAGRLHAALWAGVAAASAFLLARVWTGRAGALATVLGLFAAHGVLVFATQAEVYVPTVGSALAAAVLLVRAPGGVPGPGRIVGAAALWAVSTLYHTTGVVLALPFLLWLGLRGGRHGLAAWLALSVLAGTFVLLAQIGAWLWATDGPRTPAGFLAWMLEISSRPLTDWGSVSHLDPLDLARGFWNLAEALAMWPWALRDGLRYPWYQLPLGLAVGAVVAAVLAHHVHRPWRGGGHREIRAFLLALFTVWFLVFTWWDPTVSKFYVPAAAAAVLLASLALADLAAVRPRLARALAALAILLGGTTGAFSLAELRRSPGPHHAEAAKLAALAPPGCHIWAYGTTTGPLAFHFGVTRTRYAVGVERAFYRHFTAAAPAAEDPFAGERCAFLMVGWLSRERFERVVKPYLPTASREDYLAFVLRARPLPDGGVEHDALDVLADGDDRRYLVIDRRRRVRVSSLAETAARIDALVAEALARIPPDPPLGPGERVEFLLTPRTGFLERWQASVRMFGYGTPPEVRLAVEHMLPPPAREDGAGG